MLASYPTVETKNKSIYRKVFLKSLKRDFVRGRGSRHPSRDYRIIVPTPYHFLHKGSEVKGCFAGSDYSKASREKYRDAFGVL